jgi:hypothetical protein
MRRGDTAERQDFELAPQRPSRKFFKTCGLDKYRIRFSNSSAGQKTRVLSNNVHRSVWEHMTLRSVLSLCHCDSSQISVAVQILQ